MKALLPEGLKGTELFKFLKANKSVLIDFKKSAFKNADAFTCAISPEPPRSVSKSQYLYDDSEAAQGSIKRTIVANTYNWMDSHDDVHQDNLFSKSIKERGNKIPHLHDHIFQLDARVGLPISWQEKLIPWSDLNINKDGNTMALVLESNILKDFNKKVYKDYLNNRIDQHSVGMSYVKIDMAINDPDYEEEYKIWMSTFDKLGNQEKAVSQGYYFSISEAKLVEASAVLLGSNEITPTLGSKFEPLQNTRIKDQPEFPLEVGEMVEAYKKSFNQKKH